MKNKKSIWLLILIAIIGGMLSLYLLNRPKAMVGSKSITIEVVDSNGKTESYNGKTDAEYLSDAMDDFSVIGFSYEAKNGDYGLYITSINGIEASEKDSAYWAIYVNGDYGLYGADQQPVTDGDTYQFVYETY